MCLLTTARDYKEKLPDEASEKMLVNLVEFNNRLPAHRSEGQTANVSPRILYGSRKG